MVEKEKILEMLVASFSSAYGLQVLAELCELM